MPNLLYSAIIDRPKSLLIVSESGHVQPLEVLFVRVFAVAYKRRRLDDQATKTLALAMTPQMVDTNQPIRYGADILVRGNTETVHVLTHPQNRRQITSLLRTNRDKILQLQAQWFKRYIGDPKVVTKWTEHFADATKTWPLGLELAAYQQRIHKLAWQHRGAPKRNLSLLQQRQRLMNEQTRDAIMALTTPLTLLRQPTKPVVVNSIFGRPQRPREPSQADDAQAYVQEQVEGIMQDYLYDQAHNLPLSGKGTPLDDAELARWQQWVDETYLLGGE
ncbi:hypothetical protein [Lacticaseibacillus jixiensis]|uniref:hypothetical protein n=1 Tax=Lacticaseibacillus jixiensis TaxID=3231926 RepID=UPI0036F27D23